MRIFLISFPDPLSILYKKFHNNLWRSLLITFEIAVRWLEGNVKFAYKSAKVHYVFHHCLRFRFDDPVPKNGIIGTLATSMKMSLKIDSASFQTISRFSRVALLLQRKEFRLELKRGGCARVQTEMAEFIALPFQSLKDLKFGHFTSWLCRDSKEMHRKGWCTCTVVVLLTKPIAFWCCRCRHNVSNRTWRQGRCNSFYRNVGLGKWDNGLGGLEYGSWRREIRDVGT